MQLDRIITSDSFGKLPTAVSDKCIDLEAEIAGQPRNAQACVNMEDYDQIPEAKATLRVIVCRVIVFCSCEHVLHH